MGHIIPDYTAEYTPKEESIKFFAWNNLMFEPDDNETPKAHYQLVDEMLTRHQLFAGMCHRGFAKALSLDTKLSGTNLTIGSCRVGDCVYGSNGKKYKIYAKSEIFNKPMYRVKLGDGRTVDCSEDHLFTVVTRSSKRINGKNTSYYYQKTIPVSEILSTGVTWNRTVTTKQTTGVEYRYSLPLAKAVELIEVELPIDPYTLGLILGDGNISKKTGFVRMCGHKDDIPEIMKNIPYEMSSISYDKRNSNVGYFSIKKISKIIKSIGLNVNSYHKFIPSVYKYSSIQQRLELLKGLMDTDGTSSGEFCSCCEQLVDDVLEIARSLGALAVKYVGKGYFKARISLNINIFKLERKALKYRPKISNKIRIEAIEKIDTVPSQCIAVTSPDRLFLVNDYIVTHNTSVLSHKMPLYVASMGRLPGFGQIENAVLISDTFDQAWQQLLSCESYLERSEKLQAYLRLVKKKEGMLVFENNYGHQFHISARGAGQSFRGTNFKGMRPQWIIGDDLLSDDILYSKELNEKTIKWWSATVMKAVDINKFKVTVIGTPLLDNDLLGLIMKSDKWHTIKFPMCQEFPVRKEKIISAWPDRFTPNIIMDMYDEAKDLGTENEFFREMMLEVVTEDTRVFKKEMIVDYEYRDIKFNKHKYNFFTSMDLAATVKQKSDYTVIMTIAVNAEGHWFLVRIDRGRFNPTEAIDKLFSHVRQFKPIEFRAEKAGIQQVLGHFIEQKMLKENCHFYMNYLENNSIQKKELRILSLHPKFKNRMIHLPTDICHDEVQALKHEIFGFTKDGDTTGHDDCIDCLANFNDPKFIVTPSDYAEEYHEGMVIEYKDPGVF